MSVITFEILCAKRTKHQIIKCTGKNTLTRVLVNLFCENDVTNSR